MKTATAQPNTTDWDELERELLKKPGVQAAMKETAIEYEIARAVLEARVGKGLSQKELAAKLHTKQSVISRVENAKTKPSLDFLERLAGVLGYSLQVNFKAR
jgi:ribosome-binding protein aMBF1 (putative translation factor)